MYIGQIFLFFGILSNELSLFHLHRQVGVEFYTYLPMKIEQSVPKGQRIKFERRGINQKKAYKIQNMAKV